MELESYSAFVKAGVAEQDARAVVESINREMDRRYALQVDILATKRDMTDVKTELAEMKAELIKAISDSQRWTITAMFAAVGLFAAISKLGH